MYLRFFQIFVETCFGRRRTEILAQKLIIRCSACILIRASKRNQSSQKLSQLNLEILHQGNYHEEHCNLLIKTKELKTITITTTCSSGKK